MLHLELIEVPMKFQIMASKSYPFTWGQQCSDLWWEGGPCFVWVLDWFLHVPSSCSHEPPLVALYCCCSAPCTGRWRSFPVCWRCNGRPLGLLKITTSHHDSILHFYDSEKFPFKCNLLMHGFLKKQSIFFLKYLSVQGLSSKLA